MKFRKCRQIRKVAVILIGLFSVMPANFCLAAEMTSSVHTTYVTSGTYDVLDSHSAALSAVSPDLRQTGQRFNVHRFFSFDELLSYIQEVDLTLACGRTFLDEKCRALETYSLGPRVTRPCWEWKGYGLSDEESDHMEIRAGLSLPKLVPMGSSSLVPSYYLGYKWSANSGRPERGYFHIFGLAYNLSIPALISTQGEQTISISTDMTYNEDILGSEAGWSHTTAGISTSFIYRGFALTPSINRQWSFENAVDLEDESWVSISLSYSFF